MAEHKGPSPEEFEQIEQRMLDEVVPEQHHEAAKRLFQDPRFLALVNTATDPERSEEDLRVEATQYANEIIAQQQRLDGSA